MAGRQHWREWTYPRLALVVFVVVGIASAASLAGCSKSGSSSTPSTDPGSGRTMDPGSMHGTGGTFLIDPNEQIRWTYETMPNPAPQSRPNYLLKSYICEKGSANLGPEARGALGELVETLKARPEVTVLIVGHCDSNAEKVNAENLGMNRAQTARRFLTDRGVAKSRILASTYGSSQAQAPPSETIGQRLDRKVEIWLVSE